MITGLHCSTVFSSQFTETSFVSQYIPSCFINTLNQFFAYISACDFIKYVPQMASHAPFCVCAHTALKLAFTPLSGIALYM